MDAADRSHCSSPGTSCWLVDTVVVEPPLPEGREATGLKNFMESKTHMHGMIFIISANSRIY